MGVSSNGESREGTEPFPKIQLDSANSSRPRTPDSAVGLDTSADSVSSLPGPAYGDRFDRIVNDEAGVGSEAAVTPEGRVSIRIDQRTRGLSSLLVPALQSKLDLNQTLHQAVPPVPEALRSRPGEKPPPPLSIVIQVVGSRGDVQPFIALGKVLKEQHSHRVRLATHPVFKDFVEQNGLEFFSIGGDPSELMAFMVKNPGLMPGFDSLRRGDVGRRRREIGNMVEGCWRSCIEAGDGTSPSTGIVDEIANAAGINTSPAETARPFVADAIIANPPSFAHIHCAEKLGVPLHIMFTMPWSATTAFPHPLATIQASNADSRLANFMSYTLVDMMTWQGLGDVINRFRQRILKLEPVSLTWAPGMLDRLKIPATYCWSPSLIPKPADWGAHISIAGFYFLSLASNYTPEPDLAAFLEAGPPPVYIGFGSIVVDDPDGMTRLIFDAVRKTGRRALVSKGWGGFGADEIGIPEGVFMLGNCPHDWLFQRVACVVHHGGAGTTAAGIAAGKPTVIVPFFGDQPFWGEMVARAGAGPNPVPYKDLTADTLADAIATALEPATLEQAGILASRISHERGSETGASCFHGQLDIESMRCQICPEKVAVWRIKRTNVRLSAFAAAILMREKLLDQNDLKLYRSQEYETDEGPWDPITGGASAIVGTMTSMTMGIFDLPKSTLKALQIHPDSKRERMNSSGPADDSAQSQAPQTPPRRESSTSQGDADDRKDKQEGLEVRERTNTQSTKESDLLTPDHHTRSRAAREFLASAFSRSRSRSNSGTNAEDRRSDSPGRAPESTTSGDSGTTTPRERQRSRAGSQSRFDIHDALGSGKGLYRITSAGIKSPMDFTLGLARGFHNAPKLYGDETVRKQEKITGLKSGLKAAGKEFHYGLYDGITGLVKHPIHGVKKEGAAGFFKGVGKGVGGIVLKPSAGFWGLQGYTAKGLYRELYNKFGANIESYLMATRAAQGLEEIGQSSAEEQEHVVAHWREMRKYIRKRIHRHEEHLDQVQSRIKEAKTRDGAEATPRDEVERVLARQMLRRVQTAGTGTTSLVSNGESELDMSPLTHATSKPSQPSGTESTTSLTPSSDPFVNVDGNSLDTPFTDIGSNPSRPASTIAPEKPDQEDLDMEVAIRRSVAETSRGNREEDTLIEQAIRASVADIEAARAKGADDDAVQRAMEASIAGARRDGASRRIRESAILNEAMLNEAGLGEQIASPSSPPPYAPPLPQRSPPGPSSNAPSAYSSASSFQPSSSSAGQPTEASTAASSHSALPGPQSNSQPSHRTNVADQGANHRHQNPNEADRGSSSSSDEIEYEFDEAELNRAMTESKAMHDQAEQQRSQAAREDEVVMRYMMEQSKLEDEYKRGKSTQT